MTHFVFTVKDKSPHRGNQQMENARKNSAILYTLLVKTMQEEKTKTLKEISAFLFFFLIFFTVHQGTEATTLLPTFPVSDAYKEDCYSFVKSSNLPLPELRHQTPLPGIAMLALHSCAVNRDH